MATIGIDCGSAVCKGVLMQDNVVVYQCAMPTGWSPKEVSQQILANLLAKSSLDRRDVSIVATGYGRVGIDFADRSITEITCHAVGASYLMPSVRTVLDIGGQDSKVISVKDGKVFSFQMNDKCAAGTGRFLEMTTIRLGVTFSQFESLLDAGLDCSINSMCAVFADSEIISLLAAGKSREEVAGGIIHAVAARAVALAGQVEIHTPMLLTGGLSSLDKLRTEMSQQLGIPVEVSPDSRFAGAIGAAILAAQYAHT
ncbi:MAG: acyl-CoA dehydratase activase [Clostridiales Family XIII bacterium]|jgi:predicted CoA-substrate-specific enzyme activase|nr:acyl-CoA dehydratase activase [Clostridiales Family XIII bacterium]